MVDLFRADVHYSDCGFVSENSSAATVNTVIFNSRSHFFFSDTKTKSLYSIKLYTKKLIDLFWSSQAFTSICYYCVDIVCPVWKVKQFPPFCGVIVPLMYLVDSNCYSLKRPQEYPLPRETYFTRVINWLSKWLLISRTFVSDNFLHKYIVHRYTRPTTKKEKKNLLSEKRCDNFYFRLYAFLWQTRYAIGQEAY